MCSKHVEFGHLKKKIEKY